MNKTSAREYTKYLLLESGVFRDVARSRETGNPVDFDKYFQLIFKELYMMPSEIDPTKHALSVKEIIDILVEAAESDRALCDYKLSETKARSWIKKFDLELAFLTKNSNTLVEVGINDYLEKFSRTCMTAADYKYNIYIMVSEKIAEYLENDNRPPEYLLRIANIYNIQPDSRLIQLKEIAGDKRISINQVKSIVFEIEDDDPNIDIQPSQEVLN